ncbi:MAG: hypothetical protein HDQ99_03785 [Lachnospiraceae bacterium]|nr:hypothetical protein [Lachnospiraceae bacterium]
MKKKLPVKDPNTFISYKPFDTSRIAMLLAQEKTCKELYENFIHYRIEKVGDEDKMELDCHFNEEFSSIGIKKIPIDLLLGMKINFIEFCKESIDRNFYLFIPIETSEISNYSVYKKKKVPHHIFVYGYDDEKQVFECSEFFSFSDQGYSFESVSYKEMENAFMDLQNQTKPEMMNNEHLQWLKDIQLLHSFTEYKDKFTVQRVQIGLQNYLNERDCFGNKDYLKDVYYGYAIYDLLKEYVEQIIEKDREVFDIRSFYLIYLHFRYLRLQAEFLNDNYDKEKHGLVPFIEKFFELEQTSYKLTSLALKYGITRKKSILVRVSKLILDLKEEDEKVLESYIDYLESI